MARERGDKGRAVTLFSQAVHHTPNDAEAHFYTGAYYTAKVVAMKKPSPI